ncbi:MAG: stage III sporulation protein AB [Firmicutes bacterium]|nr:stage III sporulation protein AB [Bacillota bacterium]
MILLFLTSATVGILQCRRLDDRVIFWNAFLDFLHFAETSIRYAALPVPQLLERYCRENGRLELVKACSEQLSEGVLFPQAWEQAAKNAARRSSLPNGDLQLLQDFGAGLGASDVEGQISHCRLFAASASEIRQSAREERQQKGRLSVLLGVLLGLGIDLVLL